MDEKNEKFNRADELAREILRLSRNTLLVNLRFLDMALSKFKLLPIQDIGFTTDGEHLAYDPFRVLKRYKDEKEAMIHDYLHAVFHCIFRHMYVHTLVDKRCWDIACDIAVEYSIHELHLPAVKIKREVLQEKIFKDLQDKGIMLTAEKIYRYLLDANMSPEKLAELRGAFLADDHKIWYMSPIELKLALGLADGREKGEGDGEETDGDGESEKLTLTFTVSEQEWKEIAESLQTDLETFAKNQGDKAGGLIQNLKEVNREKYDYSNFLRKFAVLGETMKINDDEFDYVFYTYGMKLFGKMPLVEPLEYKEVKKIKEFVIAIDTSGSVVGDEVQSFIQKTYNILKSTESFFSKINLHIIQCDAVIQEHVKITNQDEFDNYIKNMKLHGFGGTDFRPVFDFVDELIKQKEFRNLKGLIYFTDGYGTFPPQMPDYQTAFVFVQDNYEIPEVPAWAIKLVLQKDEILKENYHERLFC